MIPDLTTEAEIEDLVNKLYEAKRELQAEVQCRTKENLEGHANPHFVVIARSTEARAEFENRIFAYLSKKYGLDFNKPMPYDAHPLTHASTFCFPNGISLSIICLSE